MFHCGVFDGGRVWRACRRNTRWILRLGDASNASVFALIVATTSPGVLRTTIRSHKKIIAIGGGASFVAYALVVWAFTQAPIAVVTALRETSIVFALLDRSFLAEGAPEPGETGVGDADDAGSPDVALRQMTMVAAGANSPGTEHNALWRIIGVHGEYEMTEIKEHMEVIGADGVHIGTVDRVEGKRIKLTKKDSGEGAHKGHHHYIDRGLVAGVEGDKVRLSATGAVAVTMEEEKS